MAKKKKVNVAKKAVSKSGKTASKPSGKPASKKDASKKEASRSKVTKKVVVKKKPTAAKKSSKKASPKAVGPKIHATNKAAKKKKAVEKSLSKKSPAAKVKKKVSEKSEVKKSELKVTKAKDSKIDLKSSEKSKKKGRGMEAKSKTDKSDFDLQTEVDESHVEDLSAIEIEEAFEDEVLLTDAEGNVICRLPDCDQAAQVDGYCRYHYLLFWKKIQARKKILSEGKLERYIEELTARYPDKFLDVLKKDLKSQKEFLAAIQELEIDDNEESGDFEEEDTQNYIDEIRGVGDSVGASRDDDDF